MSNQLEYCECIPEILRHPTVIDNVHESAAYRSYHILEYVMLMIERGDSKETIKEIVQFLLNAPTYPPSAESSPT